ncbi:MAG: (2Fe-2S) ferredoxin domain-containing protein [Bacteroidia bacterium]|nr:(2Fe-2S) ferredoxin domain-containing protein [Bacteroidia bacterium]
MIYDKHIFICTNQRVPGTRPSCGEQEGLALVQEFKRQLNHKKLPISVRAQKCGCLDVCEKGPMVAIYPDAVFYGGVQVKDIQEIIESHIEGQQIVSRLEVKEK